MIELAPNHKIGLSVANPILLAAGSIGYGEAVYPGLNLAKLGAVTVGPVMLHSRAGAPLPRFQAVDGGFVLDTGLQNRGLEATLRNFSRHWSRVGCPVVVQVAESNPRALPRIVQQLEMVDGVAGIELLLPEDADRRTIKPLLRAIIESCDLPLWVKLPLERAAELAPLCVQQEAVGLVIGGAVGDITGNEPVDSDSVARDPVRKGSLYGPIVFPRMLNALQQVAQLRLDCALIACGGIYTADHVKQALAAGALAVQIDSAIWVEPGLPQRLLEQVNHVS